MQSLRERLARALCVAGANSDGCCAYVDDCPQGCRHSGNMRAAVDAAIEAVLADLEDRKLRVVPEEATMAMLEVARFALNSPEAKDAMMGGLITSQNMDRIKMTFRYRAALSAAPSNHESLTGEKESRNG